MFSIIIPAFNEAEHIAATIQTIKNTAGDFVYEIIVADGGSTDETINIAKANNAVAILSEKKGRAAQMNLGAQSAKYGVLFFLHADTLTPKNFLQTILNAIEKDYKSGCFRLQFDYEHWFLKSNAWFTRFDVNAVRFGDQGLFITKEVFKQCGGFREDLYMMEDQEIIHRIKKFGRFIVMKDAVVTSARKYHDNGIYRMQAIFFRIWFLYYVGFSQQHLLRLHKKLIRKNKL